MWKTFFLFIIFFVIFISKAFAAALSLQTTSDGTTIANSFIPGQHLYLNVVVDDPTEIAGCAFTVKYDTTALDPPEVDTNGLPVGESIVSAFPFTYGTTDTFRANSADAGKVYLSGASIGSTGGPLNSVVTNTVLFTLKFQVKASVPTDATFDFELLQTELFNLAAGYGVDNNGDGVFNAGDAKEPVPVLVGAVAQGQAGFDNLDCSTSPCAFPVILGNEENPFTPVASPIVTVSPAPLGLLYGAISYSGRQSGTLVLRIFYADDTMLTSPISEKQYPWNAGTSVINYIMSLPNGNFQLAAFIDFDSNLIMDQFEAMKNLFFNIEGSDTKINFSLIEHDSNSDGIPDYWDYKYPGIGLAGDDYEADGYTNIVEFQNGTDPTFQDPADEFPGYYPDTDSRVSLITGQLINGVGEEIAGATIESDMLSNPYTSLPSGAFIFYVPNGQFMITIKANGYETLTKFIDTANESTALGQITLKPLDSDSDGMPDYWEELYGLNPNDSLDKYLDKDQDGYANFHEYQNETQPNIQDPPCGIGWIPETDYRDKYIIRGRVVNESSEGISGATVKVDSLTETITSSTEGAFSFEVHDCSHHFTISLDGYPELSFSVKLNGSDVNLGEIQITNELANLIRALKISCGLDLSTEEISAIIDIGNDGTIGIQEVIYFLQKAAGLR